MRNEIHTASAGRYREYSLKKAVIAALRVVLVWHERARQRRALARLDDRLLRDVGLSRAQAVGEARKPFWRA
jgi:uncharacterized protein YjiS (DUF1127 family)